MKKIKRLLIPALLGVVLIAAVVGVASARPNARPLEQAWRVLAVSPHACTPDGDVGAYDYTASYLECDATPCNFYCAIDFPAAGEQAVGAVNVKRLTMFAYDNTGGDVEVFLMKTYGPTGGNQQMATASSTDSASSPQTVMDTSIENNPIYRTQAPYIFVRMDDASFFVAGFHVHYTW
jgi:hypothetical protein